MAATHHGCRCCMSRLYCCHFHRPRQLFIFRLRYFGLLKHGLHSSFSNSCVVIGAVALGLSVHLLHCPPYRDLAARLGRAHELSTTRDFVSCIRTVSSSATPHGQFVSPVWCARINVLFRPVVVGPVGLANVVTHPLCVLVFNRPLSAAYLPPWSGVTPGGRSVLGGNG